MTDSFIEYDLDVFEDLLKHLQILESIWEPDLVMVQDCIVKLKQLIASLKSL